MALSKEDIFKTGPSPEEEKYNTAVELMDATKNRKFIRVMKL